jgi:putative oxidoreductase
MNVLLTLARLFLGLFLLANGLNFWFDWLPVSPPESEQANRLMDGLVFSGLFGFVKYVEIAAGLALLANRFVPLALALMLPLTVVIAYVDYVLIVESRAMIFASLLVVPQAILMLAHIRSYLPLLAYRGRPAALPGPAELQAAVFGRDR